MSEEEEKQAPSDEEEEYEDPKERMQEIMQRYKAAGGKGDQSLMQMMMQQVQGAQKGPTKPEKPATQIADERSAKDYYETFRFDEEVRYFSDFLQARMQPQNQLILPSGPGCPEENFQFYT